jgi:hypothetical protein
MNSTYIKVVASEFCQRKVNSEIVYEAFPRTDSSKETTETFIIDSSDKKVIAPGFCRSEIDGEVVYEAIPKPTNYSDEEIEAAFGRKVSFDGGCFVELGSGSPTCYNENCDTVCLYSNLGGEDHCGCAI